MNQWEELQMLDTLVHKTEPLASVEYNLRTAIYCLMRRDSRCELYLRSALTIIENITPSTTEE